MTGNWVTFSVSGILVFNATFNNISVISCRSLLLVETWYSGTLRICDIISNQAEIRKLFNLSKQCLTRKLNMIKKGFFLNKWNSVRETTISNSGKLRNYFQFKCKFGCENYLNSIKDFKVI